MLDLRWKIDVCVLHHACSWEIDSASQKQCINNAASSTLQTHRYKGRVSHTAWLSLLKRGEQKSFQPSLPSHSLTSRPCITPHEQLVSSTRRRPFDYFNQRHDVQTSTLITMCTLLKSPDTMNAMRAEGAQCNIRVAHLSRPQGLSCRGRLQGCLSQDHS